MKINYSSGISSGSLDIHSICIIIIMSGITYIVIIIIVVGVVVVLLWFINKTVHGCRLKAQICSIYIEQCILSSLRLLTTIFQKDMKAVHGSSPANKHPDRGWGRGAGSLGLYAKVV